MSGQVDGRRHPRLSCSPKTDRAQIGVIMASGMRWPWSPPSTPKSRYFSVRGKLTIVRRRSGKRNWGRGGWPWPAGWFLASLRRQCCLRLQRQLLRRSSKTSVEFTLLASRPRVDIALRGERCSVRCVAPRRVASAGPRYRPVPPAMAVERNVDAVLLWNAPRGTGFHRNRAAPIVLAGALAG